MSGCSIVEDLAAWTRTTNDSGTDGGLLTSELHAGADLSLGSSVASDCDGDSSQERAAGLHGSGIRRLGGCRVTCRGVGLGNNGGAEGAHGMTETCSRVGNGSISLNSQFSCHVLIRRQSCLRPTSKHSIDHSQMPLQRLHLRRCGLAVLHLRHHDLIAVF